MPNVVFVAPYAVEATVRFAQAVAEEEGVRLGLVSHQPVESFPEALRARLADHWRVDDALDPSNLEHAVRELQGRLGKIDRLLGILEQLQVSLASVRERVSIPGMGVEAALNFRDKARMKTVLREAGLPCARHHLATDPDSALAFAADAGFPLVAKPPAGAGARATYRVDDAGQLHDVLQVERPSPGAPILLEQYLTGLERSFDAIVLGGRVVWHSISHYRPTPLEVLRNPWIQWAILLPREIDEPAHEAIRSLGPRALQALGLETGICHMEWFELPDGELAISEAAARPPGAQLTSIIGLAHDFDLYRAWARLMVHDRFDPPARDYAAGAVFLRAQGSGEHVRALHGLEEAQHELGEVVMEAKLPRPGQPRGEGYEGDGYVLMRHPETAVVERSLARLLELLRVEAGE